MRDSYAAWGMGEASDFLLLQDKGRDILYVEKRSLKRREWRDDQMAERVMTAPPPLETRDESSWPAQGEWTYEDYLRLPDDGNRYEIIEGVLYMAPAPDFDHQHTVHQIAVAFELWLRDHAGGVVLTAPFEVHLPGIAQPVQPDVLLIAADRRPASGDRFFEGAPDLVVEILSPGTMRVDRYIKFDAYERAGVREYWLVDPRVQFVEVYARAEGGEFTLLGQFRTGEQARSEVLAGFTLDVGSLFA
jgi:Uma2 family endonuclease